MHTLIDVLRRRAEATPEQILYTFLPDEGPAETLTYAELDRRARTLAAMIASVAKPGDRALLWYPSGLEFISAFLGCLYAGVIAVPAYPPRRNRSVERLEAITGDAQPTVVLTTHEVARTLEAAPASGGQAIGVIQEAALKENPSHGVTRLLAQAGLRHLVLTDLIATETNPTWQSPSLSSDAVAFLQYTSGSTGTPKGVIVTHANLMANERCIQAGFGHTRDSVIVGWLPLFHDMGLIGNALQPLYLGARCVLMAPTTFIRHPVKWLQAITEYGGETSGGPNFAYEHCVRMIEDEQRETLDLSSWRVAYNGSEPIRPATLDQFAENFAPCGFRKQAFFPCYGLAEATLMVTGGPVWRVPKTVTVDAARLELNEVRVCESNGTASTRQLVSCGTVWQSTDVRIVDPDEHNERPTGHVGEIWVSGTSISDGYWNRDSEAHDTFRARIVRDKVQTYLRTGDLGFLYFGELFVTGRLKDLIIIRGRNIYPQDVEAVVAAAVPALGLNRCAAFSIEKEGDELLAVVAEAPRQWRSPTEDANAEASDVAHSEPQRAIKAIRGSVSREFDVAVAAVILVRFGTFPVTSSGKLRRSACRELWLSNQLEVVCSSGGT